MAKAKGRSAEGVIIELIRSAGCLRFESQVIDLALDENSESGSFFELDNYRCHSQKGDRIERMQRVHRKKSKHKLLIHPRCQRDQNLTILDNPISDFRCHLLQLLLMADPSYRPHIPKVYELW